MPLHLNIPLATLSPADGVQSLGPYTLHQNDNLVDLTIDRSVAGGFNSADSSVTMHIEVDFSADGGATWTLLVSADIQGGLRLDRNGQPITISQVRTGVDLVKNTQLRGTAVVTGGTVAVQGSFNVT